MVKNILMLIKIKKKGQYFMKKIIAIISGCLVAILLAVTITLACTKFTAQAVVNTGATSIEIFKGSSTSTLEVSSERNEYKKIMELYNKSLKENTLSSLFQGATGFDAEVKNEEVTISNITGNESTYVLRFIYDEVQTLTINNKEYVDEESETQETVTYTGLYVVVNNSANFTEYKVYLVNGAAAKSNWNVKLIAQQSDLYAYIGELNYIYD